MRQKIMRPLKKLVVRLGLIPKSMAGKKILKKLVFGNLVPMPAEITMQPARAFIRPNHLRYPNTTHKVISARRR